MPSPVVCACIIVDGMYRNWKPKNMCASKPCARSSIISFNERSGEATVKETGVYYVYSQVLFVCIPSLFYITLSALSLVRLVYTSFDICLVYRGRNDDFSTLSSNHVNLLCIDHTECRNNTCGWESENL